MDTTKMQCSETRSRSKYLEIQFVCLFSLYVKGNTLDSLVGYAIL